jgi:AraC-like DNA-binding protein
MTSLLTLLVRLFPKPFRDQFAAGMIEQVERDYDRARTRGRLAACWCVLATALDLVRSAVAERWSPTWVGPDGRLREAAARLARDRAKVIEVALHSGFADISNFNRSFRAEFGIAPQAYRSQSGRQQQEERQC